MTAFGEHEQAFAHVLAGNALQRARLTYDEASALAQLATLRRTLTRDYLDARRGAGDPADSPVFIVGMPRSGSTLIEQVLASHPDVYGAGEYPAFSGALRKRVADRYAGYDDATLLGSMTPADYTAIGEGYLHEIRALRGLEHGYRRIVDKTLVNFMHLGLIHLALPHARFIHARRSPVETCLSCFSKLLEDVPCSFDLGELGRYYAAYDELMAHWRAVLPPGVLLEVRYEEMVGDLPAQVRRILAHCGLEWHPGCLDFHHSTRPGRHREFAPGARADPCRFAQALAAGAGYPRALDRRPWPARGRRLVRLTDSEAATFRHDGGRGQGVCGSRCGVP
ncbi:MAG: sulfotransferase [Pararobbsia sp.]